MYVRSCTVTTEVRDGRGTLLIYWDENLLSKAKNYVLRPIRNGNPLGHALERPTAHFLLQTRQVGNFSVCHNPTNNPKQLKTKNITPGLITISAVQGNLGS
jgi:hypothetical protein